MPTFNTCQAKDVWSKNKSSSHLGGSRARLPSVGVSGAGTVLNLIREERAFTRNALVELTGLARSTVAQRVDALIAAGLIYEAGGEESTGGRRPVRLAFNPNAGIVLAADLGATHSRLAISDLAGDVLTETSYEMDIAEGPVPVFSAVLRRLEALLGESDRRLGDVRGFGIGIPGPVEFESGRPVNPPIMPGWDGFSIPRWVAEHVGTVPVLVDNDVNIMALGEHRAHWRDVEHLLFVKVGTGIGCGIVAGRRIHRGAEGSAGDIGHIVVTDAQDVVCRCGNTGCLEAVAGGHALARQLARAGHPAEAGRDVARLVREGNLEAIRLVRGAGRSLGEVLAASVSFFNPRVIVLGGDVGEVGEHLLAGLREVVIQRSLPLATRNLRIVPSALGDRAGVAGAAIMVIEEILAPHAVEHAITQAA
jgi:predicted NBD/HSP70 family sugar kinase